MDAVIHPQTLTVVLLRIMTILTTSTPIVTAMRNATIWTTVVITFFKLDVLVGFLINAYVML